MAEQTRVAVWGENRHEHTSEEVRRVYPRGMHGAIAEGIEERLAGEVIVRTATLDAPDHGLGGDVLDNTDVLTWWGHLAHADVSDETVDRIHKRVLEGMGLVVLHSAHESKIFKRLMGTTCSLNWREADEREVVWCVNPSHPITRGVPEVFTIPKQEMYGEYFDIPEPESLVFISSFTGGEVFRSGCCYTRGLGRVFYFSPGHETYPVYFQPEVKQVIANAVLWVARVAQRDRPTASVNTPTGWFERAE
jgi:trehalose utilization protein